MLVRLKLFDARERSTQFPASTSLFLRWLRRRMFSDTWYLSPKNLISRKKTLFTLKFEKFSSFPQYGGAFDFQYAFTELFLMYI